jgi:hypothetical protein
MPGGLTEAVLRAGALLFFIFGRAAAVARDRVANVLLAYKVRTWPATCSSSWCAFTPLATALKQCSWPFRLRAAC